MNLRDFNRAVRWEYRRAWLKHWAWLIVTVVALYTWAIGLAWGKW